MSDQKMSDPVHVFLPYDGPGVTSHNLMCWLCNERPAYYWMNPVWVFAPCEACQENITLTFNSAVMAVGEIKRKQRSPIRRGWRWITRQRTGCER